MPRLSTPRMVPTASVMFLPGMKAPGGDEHALHAGARIRRAAHDLHRLAVAGIDHADAQPVGVGMLLGRDRRGDDEGASALALSSTLSTSSPIMVSLSAIVVERRVGVEMLLQPGEGEFHGLNPPASVGKSSGRKP